MYILKNNHKFYFEDCIIFFDRLLGFILKLDKITIGKRFPKCNSIHTFFMLQNIDIIMTDKNNKIIKMYENFKPERIIFPKKNVYYTYELPLGSCKHFEIGETIVIKKEGI